MCMSMPACLTPCCSAAAAGAPHTRHPAVVPAVDRDPMAQRGPGSLATAAKTKKARARAKLELKNLKPSKLERPKASLSGSLSHSSAGAAESSRGPAGG